MKFLRPWRQMAVGPLLLLLIHQISLDTFESLISGDQGRAAHLSQSKTNSFPLNSFWIEISVKFNERNYQKNEIKTKLIRQCQTAINFPNAYCQCLSFSICRPITNSSLPCTGLQNILSRTGLSCEGRPSPKCSACHLKLCPSYYFSGFIFFFQLLGNCIDDDHFSFI